MTDKARETSKKNRTPTSERVSETVWTDPDDAPELTDEWIEGADLHHGGMLVRRARSPAAR